MEKMLRRMLSNDQNNKAGYNMKKELLFVLSVLNISLMRSMETDIVKTLLATKRPDQCEMSAHGWMVYIGQEEARYELEAIFGKKFPLNTIFQPVIFYNHQAIGLAPANPLKRYIKKSLADKFYDFVVGNPDSVPEYVAYDDIKDAKEGAMLQLALYGKVYSIVCTRNKYSYGKESFEQELHGQLNLFSMSCNCLPDGQKSLVDASIIDIIDAETKSPYLCAKCQHDQNASPYIIKESKPYSLKDAQ